MKQLTCLLSNGATQPAVCPLFESVSNRFLIGFCSVSNRFLKQTLRCSTRVATLLLVILMSVNMWATDFTLTSESSVTNDGITVSFAQGSGSSAPKWYDNGLRLYASNTITISSSNNITAITFNWEKQGSKAFASALASTGNYTHPSAAGAGTWTGSAKSVTFTLGSSGQLQLNTFSVTAASATKCEDPKISVAGGIYTEAKSVTLSCTTKDAAIHYTTDGTTPTSSSPTYSSAINVNQDMTIKAIATKSGLDNSGEVSAAYIINYKVTFNNNGHGTAPSAISPVKYNASINSSKPADPSVTGYTFGGWYKENTCTNAWNWTTDKVTGNTTLYAKWTANKYNLTFNKNDDEAGGSMDSQEFTFNVAQNLNHCTFTAPAHKYFTGWATSPNGSVAKSDGASYTMTTEGATLYAVWAWNKTTITLNQQEGSGGTSSVTATYGQAMPTLSTIPSRNGYEFAGYYSEPNDAGTRYYNADKSSAATWLSDDKNATLYAHWTPKTISVTFDENGHGVADGSATIVFNTSTWVTSTFVKASTGYTLNGYYTSSTGGSKVVDVNGTLVPNVSNYTSADGKWIRYSSPTTLYAQYSPINYPVKWMVSGEEWKDKDGSVNADYDAKIAAVPTAPETSDCDFTKVFVGWTANEIEGTTDTRPADLFTKAADAPTIKGNTTYYAVFALPEESTTDYAKGTLADLQTGKRVLILSGSTSESALSSEVGAGGDGYLNIENVTITNNVISNPINSIIWNVTKNNGKYRFDQGASKMLNLVSDMKLYANSTIDEWTITDYDGAYRMKSTLNANGSKPYFDLYGSTSGFSSYSSMGSNKVDFYLPATTYSEYATTCVPCMNVITINKGEEVAHGSYNLSKTGEVCLSNIPEGTYSVTVTATPDEHYHFATVTTSSGTAGEVVDNTCVVSGITETTTLTAVFTEDPQVTVTWHIGAGSQETKGVYVGSTYSLLEPPTVADNAAGDCANKFMGWATDAISTPTDAAGFEAIQVSDDIVISESQKDFYAVFASKVGEEPTSVEFNPTSLNLGNSFTDYTQLVDGVTFTFSNAGKQSSKVRMSKSSTLTQDKALGGKITSISFKDFAYSSTSDGALTVEGCATPDGTYTTVASKGSSYNGSSIDFSAGNYYCLRLTVGSSRTADFTSLTINYLTTSYGNYITQCCTPWTPSLSYNSYTMQVGEEQDANIAETNYGTPQYSSDNTNAITVDENTGHIKAVGGGTATISVTWAGDDTYCEQSTSSQEITVNGSLQVSFNGNGADGGTAMEPQSVEYGVETKINKNTYTKTGYTFLGWAETSDATSIKYTDEQSETFTAGVELFAVWRINAHVVTIQDATGGTIAIEPKTTTIDYGTTVTATATLTPGYNFVSWSATPAVTFADATNKSTTFSMPDDNVLLTASYTPILVSKIDLKKGSEVVTALEFEKNVTAPVTLTTAFTPADALDKTVEWHSGNTDVVTVDNGVLTAQGLGTAVVTATSTVVPSVAGSVTVTVYEWQDADPVYTLTNQPASTVYYETNKIDFANWTINHNLKRSDDATKTKQETVAVSDWTVTIGGVVIENKYTLTTADNGKALVIKVGETELYNQTLTVNEKAKHTYIDRVHGNEDKVMMDTYTIPSLSNTSAATEGDCATTHYVFKGWVAEANADVPTDANLIAAGGHATAEADATFYAVWAERRNVTEDKTLKYGWESTDSKTGWTISGSTSSSARTGSKSGSVTGSGTSADWTNCIQTSSTITKPKSIKCYYSKDGTNTNSSSYWAIEVKPASGSWTEVATGKTYNNVEKNTWYELSADLSSYSKVVVAINAKTNNSARLIDDVEFVYEETTLKDVDYITECVTRYELSFDANGGTGAAPKAIMLKEGGKVALPNATLAKAYNDFSGWNTAADGNGTHYNVGAEYTMGDAAAVLYADWAPLAVTALEITSEATAKEFGIGQTFNADGLKVKATYEGGETESNVEFTTNFDGHVFTEQETGTQTVKVSYKGFSADLYTVTVAPALMVRFYVNGQMIQEKPVFDKKIGTMPNAMTTWNEITGNEARPDLFPVFAGWIIGDNLTDNPTFVSDATEIEGDVNVHAVFAHDYTINQIGTEAVGAAAINPAKRYVIGVTVNDKTRYYKGTVDSKWAETSDNLDDAEIVAVVGKSAPYAIQQTNGTYFVSNNGDFKDLAETAEYSFSITENNYIKNSKGEYYLSRNVGNNVINTGLRWYGTGNDYPKAFLYEADVTYDQLTLIPYGIAIRKNLSNGKIGSMCQNREILAVAGGHLYQPNYVNGYTLEFIEVKYPVEAGMPLIYQTDGTNDGNLAVIYGSKEIVTEALEGDQTRGMVGYISNVPNDQSSIPNYSAETQNYVFQNNKLYQANNNYLTNDRAYVKLDVVKDLVSIQEPTATPRRRLSMGVPHSTATNLNELLEQDTKQCIKFIRDNKLFILREGKIYDATGKKIK